MQGFRRGARVINSRWGWVGRLGLGLPRGPTLRLAGVRIAALDESKHFKFVGTTGTGKSTAIAELLETALARGDRAVVADPEGGYLRRFGDPRRGDVVLNPFEPHSARWDPFAEIETPYDIDQLAASLISGSADPAAREWRGYARTFLAALTRYCRERNVHDVAELWRLIAVVPPKQLRRVVAGTPAQPFLSIENARMFGSIRAVTASAAAALEYVGQQRSEAFSVRRWIQRGTGALFMPYRAGQIASLRGIIATWLRLAIFEAMSCGNAQRRIWFVVDELDALGAIDGLKDALTRLRKFGGRCVLGFQSMAQVSSTYGQGDAQTIVENCGNTFILRCSGSEQGGTSQFASRLIGEREVIRRQLSRGRDGGALFAPGQGRSSTTTSRQYVTETAVMASEIEQLPDLCGYLKTASSPNWRRVWIARQ